MGDVPLSKRCTKCKEVKVVSEFHRCSKNGDGLKCRCKDCRAEYARDYMATYNPAYYKVHREEIKAAANHYYKENTEQVCERMRDYCREYAEDNRSRALRWAKDNRERFRENQRAYRHRRRSNGGSHTVEEWLALCATYDGKCARCGAEEQTLDHIVPVLLGGSNDIENIQPLCRSCNSSKGAKVLDYRRSTVDRVL